MLTIRPGYACCIGIGMHMCGMQLNFCSCHTASVVTMETSNSDLAPGCRQPSWPAQNQPADRKAGDHGSVPICMVAVSEPIPHLQLAAVGATVNTCE